MNMTAQGHPWTKEVRDLIKDFYGQSSGKEPSDLSIQQNYNTDTGEFSIERIEEGKIVERVVDVSPDALRHHHAELRLWMKRRVYDALHQWTQRALPWGILTGVRPEKIVRQDKYKTMTWDQVKRELMTTQRVSQEKAELLLKVGKNQGPILDSIDRDGYSLYVDVPFCPTRCAYCSFPTLVIDQKNTWVEPYLTGVIKELAFSRDLMGDRPLQSVYIGGGTPTALSDGDLEVLLSAIDRLYPARGVEYTVEAGRPETITRKTLDLLKSYGVNRISVNPQSMHQKTLDAIGRRHTPQGIETAYAMVKEVGFSVTNMDLIAGLPGESVADYLETVDWVLALEPENITVHTLAIKKGSTYADNKKKASYPDSKEIEDMLRLGAHRLTHRQYEPYYLYRQRNMVGSFENVGYALSGGESFYNIAIMEEAQTIMACGMGATSKLFPTGSREMVRVANFRSMEVYLDRLDDLLQKKAEALT